MSNQAAITVSTLWRYPVKAMMGEVMQGGQTALSFAHHLLIKAVGRKALPTLHD